MSAFVSLLRVLRENENGKMKKMARRRTEVLHDEYILFDERGKKAQAIIFFPGTKIYRKVTIEKNKNKWNSNTVELKLS